MKGEGEHSSLSSLSSLLSSSSSSSVAAASAAEEEKRAVAGVVGAAGVALVSSLNFSVPKTKSSSLLSLMLSLSLSLSPLLVSPAMMRASRSFSLASFFFCLAASYSRSCRISLLCLRRKSKREGACGVERLVVMVPFGKEQMVREQKKKRDKEE